MNDTLGIAGIALHLKEKKGLWLILLALVVGVCLMAFEGVPSQRSDVAALEDEVVRLCERATGASDVYVMLRCDSEGEVLGIAVVCSLGESASVRLTVTEMLTALFGIPSSAVSVVAGK